MIGGLHLTVVVPAFDEEALLGQTLASVPDEVDRVIVVDDGSRDRTAEVARRGRPGGRETVVVAHGVNRGVGAAIVTGYRRFLELGGDVCVVMAADGQMDPADLPALLGPIESGSAGYAKGNRFATRSVIRTMPWPRLLGNLGFSLLTKLATGQWHLMDSQCGYTAITREALARLPLGSLYPRYGFPNDLLLKLSIAGVKIADVPVSAVYGSEISGINPWVVVPRILVLLLGGFWTRLWRKHVVGAFHPLAAVYAAGFLLVAAAPLVSVALVPPGLALAALGMLLDARVHRATAAGS